VQEERQGLSQKSVGIEFLELVNQKERSVEDVEARNHAEEKWVDG